MLTQNNIVTFNKPNDKRVFLKPRIRKECLRFNHIFAGVVSLLLFLAIYTLFLQSTLNDRPPPPRDDGNTYLLPSGGEEKIGRCEIQHDCDVFCTHLRMNIGQNVTDTMEGIDETICGLFVKLVTLDGVTYPNQSLTENWIDSDKYYIETMEIKSDLKYIHPKAFNKPIFSRLSKLTLSLLRLKVIESNSFQGLLSLQHLNIRDSIIYVIESDAMKPIANTLNSLQIQLHNEWNPKNVTGASSFQVLLTVDFRYNNFGMSLTENTFTGIAKCRQLYLVDSRIYRLPESIFSPLTELVMADISENNLQTLPQNIFQNLVTDSSKFKIFLRKNQWNCNCDLMFLKELQDNGYLSDDPICVNPSSFSGQSFRSIPNFCQPSILDSSSQSTYLNNSSDKTKAYTNEPLPQTLDPQTMALTCFGNRYLSENQLFKNVRKPRSLTNAITTYVERQSITFYVDNEGLGYAVVKFDNKPLPQVSLIYFGGFLKERVRSIDNVNCIMELARKTYIYNLTAGETYTFCVINQNSFTISPFNCRSCRISLPWSEQSWISNKKRVLFVSMSIVMCIVCLILGASFVYILIRKKPSLLRGSKRVVLVKHRAADVIVMPSNFYNNGNENVKSISKTPTIEDRKAKFSRSVSEVSMASYKSVTASYVSAVQPTQDQLVSWRMERFRERCKDNSRGQDLLTVPHHWGYATERNQGLHGCPQNLFCPVSGTNSICLECSKDTACL